MIPAWVGLLAGTLAAKMGGNAARKGAAAKMHARAAGRLGAPADMVEAIGAEKEIDAQEGAAIGKAGANFVLSSFDDADDVASKAKVAEKAADSGTSVPLAPAETKSQVALMFPEEDDERSLLKLALRNTGYGRLG